MTDIKLAVAPTRTAEIRGRASGVSIMAFFALAWIGWGTSDAVAGTTQVDIVVAAAVLSVVLIMLAWGGYRRAAARVAQAPAAPGPSWGRRFGRIVAAEWIGLGIVAVVLGTTGHPASIAAVICLGVGIHFLPLARLFHVRVYLLTGTLLGLIAVATLVIAPLTSTSATWTALPGFGAAIVLYATSVALLTERRQ